MSRMKHDLAGMWMLLALFILLMLLVIDGVKCILNVR